VDLTLSSCGVHSITISHAVSHELTTPIGITEEDPRSTIQVKLCKCSERIKITVACHFYFAFHKDTIDVTKPTVVVLASGDRVFVLYIPSEMI
jgi:hypothetical protein